MDQSTPATNRHRPTRLRLARCEIDLGQGVLRDAAGSAVHLRPQVWAVLQHFARNPNRVISKEELLATVWPGLIVTDGSVTQAISDVRAALGDTGHAVIKTMARRGYLLALDPAAAPADKMPAGADGVLVRPSIAVLAFTDTSPAQADAALGRWMAYELILELARNADLRVISRHSSFAFAGTDTSLAEIAGRLRTRFIVDGTIRRQGESVRVAIELIDSQSGDIVWTMQQCIGADELGALRDEWVQRIAGCLYSNIQPGVTRGSLTRSTKLLDIYALVEQAIARLLQFSPDSLARARSQLEQALALDGELPSVWSALAHVNLIDAWLRLTPAWRPDLVQVGIAQASRALELNPDSQCAYRALAHGALLQRDFAAVTAYAECAVQLAPSDGDALAQLACVQAMKGELGASMRSIEAALQRLPLRPGFASNAYAFVLLYQGRHAEALAAANDCLAKLPYHWHARLNRLVALDFLDRKPEARQEAANILRVAPWVTSANFMTERSTAAAIAAGIPRG